MMDLDQDFFDKLAKNIGNEVSKAVENKFKCVADEQMDLIRANQEWVEQLKEYQKDYNKIEENRIKDANDLIYKQQEQGQTLIENLDEKLQSITKNSIQLVMDEIKDTFQKCIDDQEKMLDEKINENCSKILDSCQKSIEKMQQSYQEQNEKNLNMYEGLIQKNVEMYDTKLKSFIPIFTEANARALAEVEKDNIETIANAYKAVQKLEDSQSGMMQAIAMVVKNISDDSKKIRQAITKDQTDLLDDKIEDLNENLKKIFSNFKNETTGNMKEHQDRMETLEKQIEELSANYSTMMEQFQIYQRDIYQLDEKDLELLQKILEE